MSSAAHPRLTELARQHWAELLQPGDTALDCTAGNGHDTLALARSVAPSGRVFGIDLQPAALAATRARLEQHGMGACCQLIAGDHGELTRLLPTELRGCIRLAVFNLGYLPGHDHALTTRAGSTLRALAALADWLAPQAAISVIAYRGHPGGEAEAQAVAAFLLQLPAPWQVTDHREAPARRGDGPVFWLVQRIADQSQPTPAAQTQAKV